MVMVEVLQPLSHFLIENCKIFVPMSFIIYSSYYFLAVVHRPRVICKSSKFNRFIDNHLTILKRSYWPTPWLINSHQQTVLRVLLQRNPKFTYSREELTTDDGGLIYLDWSEGPISKEYAIEDKPTVLILPGLTGDSHVNYVKQLVELINLQGYRAVVFNNRGLGGAPLQTPRTFCPPYCSDVELIVNHVRNKYQNAPLAAVGVSLGGIILLNYLAKDQAAKPIIAAFVSSVGWDISKSMKSLEQPINQLFYNRHCTRRLQKMFKKNKEYLLSVEDQYSFNLDKVYSANSLRQIDQYYKLPVFGYNNIDEYYAAGSPARKLRNLTTPVLCINAADDPFSPSDAIPVNKCDSTAPLALVVTKYGGHIGFMEGALPFGPTFSDKLAAQFINSVFKYHHELP